MWEDLTSLRQIGSGRGGVVYAAEWKEQPIAVKVIHPTHFEELLHEITILYRTHYSAIIIWFLLIAKHI